VTVTDTTLTGGAVTFRESAGSNNSISAAGDTGASKGKFIHYVPGTGSDSFTGGFENDTIYMAARTALSGDTFTGGSGTNAVVMTSAGTVDLDGVSKFPNIYLANGNNTVTVTDTTLSGGSVAVHDRASGSNSISAIGDTAASSGNTLYYVAGTGPDTFTGGFEDETVYVSAAAAGGDTVTGGSGTDVRRAWRRQRGAATAGGARAPRKPAVGPSRAVDCSRQRPRAARGPPGSREPSRQRQLPVPDGLTAHTYQ
jgi:hypothetical protein